MKRTALMILMVFAIGGATAEAAVVALMSPAAAKSAETKNKVKKRRGFKSLFAKSVGFIGESAFNGGMSDR